MNCEFVVLRNKLLQVVLILIRCIAHYFSGACTQSSSCSVRFFPVQIPSFQS